MRVDDGCNFKKYLDRWHTQHQNEPRDCVLYSDINKEFCKKIKCPYIPKDEIRVR